MQPDNNNNTNFSNNNYPSNKTQNINNNNINNNNKSISPQPRSHSSAAQACAACKHQRRKCTPDCILAPYFPHDRQRQFLNAHRLFGVSNIVKIVKKLQPPAKDHAMRTIIFQSDARAADPVGGCYRIIRDLEQQISFANAELDLVLHQLAICRATAQQNAVLENYNNNEKLKNQIGVDGDMNLWDCMNGNNNPVHGIIDSTSSSSLRNPNLVRNVSLDDCNGKINDNLDRLSCEDAKGGFQV